MPRANSSHLQPRPAGRRWLLRLLPAALGALGLLLWWLLPGEEPPGEPHPEPSVARGQGPGRSAGPGPASLYSVAPGKGPVMAPAPDESPDEVRRRELELWMRRLERAERTLSSYVESTRYPPDSRPISEHPDQVYPNAPIDSTRPLTRPGKGPHPGSDTQLQVRQERVFVVGDESVRFSLAAQTGSGLPLPLRVTSAIATPRPDEGAPPTLANPVPVSFNDEGLDGDEVARDGTHTVRLTPARQGFAQYHGAIRLDVSLSVGDEDGGLFFDIVYTPTSPATYTGKIREALVKGSLVFDLGVNVQTPGRYVVSGRVDDSAGKPFALVMFNDMLPAGPGEIRLVVFGKLILDQRPAFPLKLRDVDAFLLLEDVYPDRALLPRLTGYVHTTHSYPETVFSDAEWQSEERDRYVTEYTRDVNEARAEVDVRQPPGR